MELLFEAVGAFTIGFVEDEDVADLHQAGLHVLNIVAEARDEHDDHAIGEANDVDFVLADADGFDEDLVLASSVEEQRDFGGGASEAAKESASGHGANENSGITGVRLHANSIAEDSASGVGTGGIDSDDADGFFVFAMVRGKAIDEGAFASARSTGNAREIGGTRLRKKNLEERLGFRRVIFYGSDGARDGANFAGADLLRPGLNGQRHFCPASLRSAETAFRYYFFPSSCRAMTNF